MITGFHKTQTAVVIAAAFAVSALRAQPSDSEEQRAQKGERAREQIIYNLSSASHESALALHSQSKTADYSLPVDPGMPISLQVARSSANAAAQQPPSQPTEPMASPAVTRRSHVQRTKPTRVPRAAVPAMRAAPAMRIFPGNGGGHGRGNGHGRGHDG